MAEARREKGRDSQRRRETVSRVVVHECISDEVDLSIYVPGSGANHIEQAKHSISHICTAIAKRDVKNHLIDLSS